MNWQIISKALYPVCLVLGLAIGGVIGYKCRVVPEPTPPEVRVVNDNQAVIKADKLLQENSDLKKKLEFRQQECDELYRQLNQRQFGNPQRSHLLPVSPPLPKKR
jgi:hypothetical protein